jgi:uncharacterized membrane protein
MSRKGRPGGEHRSARRDGAAVSAKDRPGRARGGAQRDGSPAGESESGRKPRGAPGGHAAPGAARQRLPAIDALRGAAIVAMIAYHFCFDLTVFGLSGADFYRDPFWIGARGLIVTSFLLLAGISLVLAHRDAVPASRFWRRWLEIAAAAALVSAGSYLMFPRSFIYFGILHGIAASLLLARPLAAYPMAALAVGIAAIVVGNTVALPFFDAPLASVVGLTTRKPPTEDYVPLLPWCGVVLVGIAAGHALARRRFALLAPLDRAPRWLAWLGRHSLPVYLVHQPVLLGALWLVARR